MAGDEVVMVFSMLTIGDLLDLSARLLPFTVESTNISEHGRESRANYTSTPLRSERWTKRRASLACATVSWSKAVELEDVKAQVGCVTASEILS